MRLLSNLNATPTTRRVRVALEGAPFSYEPGQAASLGVIGQAARTPYSIASAPHETARDGCLEFLVKVDGSNRFGAQVGALQPGLPVSVTGPTGSFTFPKPLDARRLLFIAGGTGIAPLRSMMRHAIDTAVDAGVALLYSARMPDEFAYLDELRALERDGRLTLSLTLTGPGEGWAHARGRAGADHLGGLVGPDSRCFVCGPPSMVTEVPQALLALGVPRAHIRTEDW